MAALCVAVGVGNVTATPGPRACSAYWLLSLTLCLLLTELGSSTSEQSLAGVDFTGPEQM